MEVCYRGQWADKISSIPTLPRGGLEILIFLFIERGDSSEKNYQQMIKFVDEFYLEPEKIPIKEEYQEKNEDWMDLADL